MILYYLHLNPAHLIFVVFSFQTDVIISDAKHSFTAHTDILWGDFKDRCLALLDGTPKPIQLAYKVSGDAGKPSHLNDAPEFVSAMERLCSRAQNARTKAVYMEVQNIVSCSFFKGIFWIVGINSVF